MRELTLTIDKEETSKVKGKMVAIESDGLHQVRIMKNVVTDDYRKELLNQSMVKLIVMDAAFYEFKKFSDDVDTQDLYKLKKNYNARTWVRMPITINADVKGCVQIAESTESKCNAYLVISKHDVRMGQDKQGVMLRYGTDIVKEKCNNLIKDYITKFNLICKGDVYDIHFEKEDDNDIVTDVIAPIMSEGNNQYILEEIVGRMKLIDAAFDELLDNVLGTWTRMSTL